MYLYYSALTQYRADYKNVVQIVNSYTDHDVRIVNYSTFFEK